MSSDKKIKLAQNGHAQDNAYLAAAHEPNLDVTYIVEDLFRVGKVGFLTAPPSVGKTSLLAMMCANIARRHYIGELGTTKAGVCYLAAEDAEGVMNRAYMHLKDADPAKSPFVVIDRKPDLSKIDDVEAIIADIEVIKERFQVEDVIFVVDTLNRAIGIKDENSATAMAHVISNIGLIAKSTNSYSLCVHHTPHGDSTRGRGSSAIGGNVEDDLLLVSEGKRKPGEKGPWKVQIAANKQKNSPPVGGLVFEVFDFHVGLTKFGKPFTLPVANVLTGEDAAFKQAANKTISPSV